MPHDIGLGLYSFQMGRFVVAEFLLTSVSRRSAIAELVVIFATFYTTSVV